MLLTLTGHLCERKVSGRACIDCWRIDRRKRRQLQRVAKPVVAEIGRKYGRLTVISDAPGRTYPSNLRYVSKCWLCRCECGNEKIIEAKSLHSGATVSCGCYCREVNRKVHETHRQAGGPRLGPRTAEYNAWRNMLARCFHPRFRHYRHYGGRGITVAQEWIDSFEKFFAHMGARPSSKHSIDRIDVNGNYQPGNCRWATQKEQLANRRKSVKVLIEGSSFSITELAESHGLTRACLRGRLKLGWPLDKALNTPQRPKSQ